MDKYAISLITPFHDVDEKIFKKCYLSVKNQTYGFRNIEWIIAVHNSSHSLEMINRLFKDCPNVKIITVENNIHSPSSPRNSALKIATGTYVTFLDADDYLLDDCIKKVFSHIGNKDIDIITFRREYSVENNKVKKLIDKTLFDQTNSEIIIDKKHFDSEKIFSGYWGIAHAKIYNRKFLISNKIRYDENVVFAEDFLFNIEAYKRAKKILILPQLIGYHYFINSNSLVQSSNKPASLLITYAKGYKKVFDLGLKYGFYMDDTISLLTFHLAIFMVENTTLTKNDREEIKKILEPYLKILKPLKVSKLYSRKDVHDHFNFPKDVIMNIDKWDKADKDDNLAMIDESINNCYEYQKTLKSILEKNIDSDIGKKYNFANIYTISQYKKTVPLSDYDTYSPLIDLTSKVGDTDIYTSEAITNYLYSVGSFNIRKILPCTSSHIYTALEPFENLFIAHDDIYICLAKIENNNPNELPLYSMYSTIMYEVILKAFENGKFDNNRFVQAMVHYIEDESIDYEYLSILGAIANPNISKIFALNTFILYRIYNFIINNFDRICNDIKCGQIKKGRGSKNVYRFLPNVKRAKYLENRFKKGNITLLDIWPKLKTIYGRNDNNYSIYTDSLKSIADNVSFINYAYVTPEAIIGEKDRKSNLLKLYFKNGYYEFISCRDNKVYDYKNLKINEEYQVVITNYAGLYRYKSKYIIIVDKIIEDNILFHIGYSKEEICYLNGVRLDNDDIYKSLNKVSKKNKIKLNDYLYYIEDNKCLNIYLDIDAKQKINRKKLIKLKEDFIKELMKQIPNLENNDVNCYKFILLKSNSILLNIDESINRSKLTLFSYDIKHCIVTISMVNSLHKHELFIV